MKPVLLVIAGPNGSGKTTVTVRLRADQWSEGSRTASGLVSGVVTHRSHRSVSQTYGPTNRERHCSLANLVRSDRSDVRVRVRVRVRGETSALLGEPCGLELDRLPDPN